MKADTWMKSATAITVFVMAAALSLGAKAQAPAPVSDTVEEGANRFEGDWPKRAKPVKVNLSNASPAEALQTLCDQLGWGLVMAQIPDGEAQLTLRLQGAAGPEVLETILASGHLRAELKGQILFVTRDPVETTAPPPVPPAPVIAQPGPSDEPGDTSAEDEAEASAEPGAKPSDMDELEEDMENLGRELEEDMEKAFGTMGDKWKRKMSRKLERKLKKLKRMEKRLPGKNSERVQIGKSLRIEEGEEVDTAVVLGGDLSVAGHVRRDAVAVGGSVTLEPGAEVEGNAVSVGGTVEVMPGAELSGDRVGVGGPFGKMVKEMFSEGLSSGRFGVYLFVLSVLGKLLRIALLFAAGILVLTFMPKRYATVRDYITHRPGKSALAGLVIFAAMIPVTMLLMLSVIGWPVIPFLFLALLVFVVLGLTSFLTWLGDRIPVFKGRKSPVGAFAIGCSVFFLVSLVPVLGTVALTAVSLICAGAALLTRFGSRPGKDPAPTPETLPAT